MIRTIAVRSGTEDCLRAAQDYALELSSMFSARLRLVGVWGAQPDTGREGGEPAENLVRAQIGELLATAKQQGVTAEERPHGEGVVDGLMLEAEANDLLVLGLPDKANAADSKLTKETLEDDLQLVRSAEAAVLVVRRPPGPTRTVLVNYQGERDGKQALRLSGHWAERCRAGLVVLTIESDPARAKYMGQVAREYLRGFALPRVEIVDRRGDPGSEISVVEAAEEAGADLIAIGAKPYGLLDRFLDRDKAEDLATTTAVPVLIGR